MLGRFQLNLPDKKKRVEKLAEHFTAPSQVHVNNALARERRGVTKQYLLELLKMADSLGCDALGGDFNQGIHQLDAIQKEFILCQTALPQMPVETDVTGWLLPKPLRALGYVNCALVAMYINPY